MSQSFLPKKALILNLRKFFVDIPATNIRNTPEYALSSPGDGEVKSLGQEN